MDNGQWMNGLMDRQTISCRDAIDATENDNFPTDYVTLQGETENNFH